MRALRHYLRSLSGFSGPVRRLLLATFFLGLAGSINALVLNFYLEALGLGHVVVGVVNSLPALAVVACGWPSGRWGARLGPRNGIWVGAALLVLSALGVPASAEPWEVAFAVALAGVGGILLQSNVIAWMTGHAPDGDRVRLFSAQGALGTATWCVGSLLGGWLPGFVAGLTGGSAAEVGPLRTTLFISAAVAALSVVPFAGLREVTAGTAPLPEQTRGDAGLRPLFVRLLTPRAAIALGAGLTVPFFNVYVHGKFGASYDLIGAVFSASSLLSAMFMLAQPWLAGRYGKVRAVIIGQAASLPFLLMLGYAPWFPAVAVALFLRGALMNMAQPVYTAFCMDKVPAPHRAFFMSLDMMVWNGFWAVGSNLSGQVREVLGFEAGFHVLFAAMALLYVIGTGVFAWWYSAEPVPQDARAVA